jgi:hypothetical protein
MYVFFYFFDRFWKKVKYRTNIRYTHIHISFAVIRSILNALLRNCINLYAYEQSPFKDLHLVIVPQHSHISISFILINFEACII